MDHLTLVRNFLAEGQALVDSAKGHLDDKVPSCPGWRVRDVVEHLGAIYHHRIELIRVRSMSSGDELPLAPYEDQLIDWLDEGHYRLFDLLERTDPKAPVWNWSGKNQTVGFWARRMAHETAVHRWDVESAYKSPADIGGELARDGIDEFIELALNNFSLLGEESATVHLHRLDGEGEWLITLSEDGVEFTHEHGKGDVAARGTASDLLLVLWRRKEPSALEIFGDKALFESFIATPRL